MSLSSSFRAVLCLLLVLSLTAFAQSPATPRSGAVPSQIPGQNALLMGAAWYPEQWPEARWEEGLRLMEAANLKVVRIAEFAWSRMEPSEGHYDFDWLERAINLAAKHHIISVVGTPTATPPAWLTQKYHPARGRARRAGDSRQPCARLFHFPSLSRILPPHCRADGDPLRPQSQRCRLAD